MTPSSGLEKWAIKFSGTFKNFLISRLRGLISPLTFFYIKKNNIGGFCL